MDSGEFLSILANSGGFHWLAPDFPVDSVEFQWILADPYNRTLSGYTLLIKAPLGSLNSHGFVGVPENTSSDNAFMNTNLLQGNLAGVNLAKNIWENMDVDGTYADLKDVSYQSHRQGIASFGGHDSCQWRCAPCNHCPILVSAY